MNKETIELIGSLRESVRIVAAGVEDDADRRRVDKALYRMDEDLQELLDPDSVTARYPGPGWHRD
jgi:hypothetical protein